MQPALQILAGTDVIARKDVCPSQAAEQHVFRRPTPHATQPAEAGDGLLVGQARQPFQIRLPIGAGPGQLDHGTALLPTEAQPSERFRFQPGQVFRAWERANRPLFPGDDGAVVVGQAVEQTDAERERDLLAGDRIDDALKHGSEARRLHSAEPLRQGTQLGITRGQAIERSQVDA